MCGVWCCHLNQETLARLKVEKGVSAERIEELERMLSQSVREADGVARSPEKAQDSMKELLVQAEMKYKVEVERLCSQHAQELKHLEQSKQHEMLVRLAGLDEQYQEQIVALTTQLADREESQVVAKRELARSTSAVQDVTTELEQLKSVHAEQLQHLQKSKQEAMDRVAELEEQVDRIKWRSKEEIDALHVEKTGLEKELADLREGLRSGSVVSDKELQLRREIEQLQADRAEALSNMTTQSSDDGSAAEASKEIERLSASLQQAHDTLSARDRHIRSLDDKRIELLHLYDSSTKDAADLRKELSSVRAQLDLHVRSARVGNEQHAAATVSTEAVAQLRHEKKQLAEHIHELEDQLESVKISHKTEVDALKKQIADMEEAHSRARTDLRNSVSLVEDLEKQLKSREMEHTQLHDLQRTHGEVVRELESIRRQLHDEVMRGSASQEKLVRETEKNLGKSQKLLEKALARISALEQSDCNHDAFVRLHVDLADSRREAAAYAQELLESAEREDAMQQNIQDLQQEVVRLVALVQNLQQQVEELESYSFPHMPPPVYHPFNGRGSRHSYDISDSRRAARDLKRADTVPVKRLAKEDPEALAVVEEKYRRLLEESTACCAEQEREIIRFQEQAEAKEAEVVEMQKELDRLQAENAQLLCDLNAARKEAGEAKLSVSAEKFRTMCVEATRRCSELEKELLVAHEQGNAKTMKAMEDLHRELGLVQTENHDLQRDLYEARKEASDSKMLIQQMELRHQEKLRELQDIKDQLKRVRSSVSEFYGPLQKMFDSDSA